LDFLVKLLDGRGVASSLTALCLAIVLGMAMGRIRVFGIRFGVGGVLFSGIVLAHSGIRLDSGILHFVREFGLILFVFAVGQRVGPGFVDSLRRRGLFLNLAAVLNVILGAGAAALFFFAFNPPLPAAIGILCGAVTNTPSLAAASEVFHELMPGAAAAEAVAEAGTGYAIAYPCGILGIILTMILARFIFRINPGTELAELKRRNGLEHPPLRGKTFIVANPDAFALTIRDFLARHSGGIVISRYGNPGGGGGLATPDTVLTQNMLLHAVGTPAEMEKFQSLVGEPADTSVPDSPGSVARRRLVVSQSRAAGKSLRGLGLTAERRVTVTRLVRAGVESTPGDETRLHYGDSLVCVGEAADLDRAEKAVGNSPKELEHPRLAPVFLGILLGVVIGSIPISIPGLPSGLKLGLAGGPLVIAIATSRINNFAGLIWHLQPGGNLILREFGIALFMACVGLNAGEGFIETLLSANGPIWIGAGACITFVPLIIVSLLARMVLRYDYASICGLLSGAMTDPPALAFSVQMLKDDAPASVYATVYPLTMLLRIFSAQVLVILLSRPA
jgi:putative transport protein